MHTLNAIRSVHRGTCRLYESSCLIDVERDPVSAQGTGGTRVPPYESSCLIDVERDPVSAQGIGEHTCRSWPILTQTWLNEQ